MSWLTWPGRIVVFCLWYLKEFIAANAKVTINILRIRPDLRPGIVRINAASRTDTEYTLISSLITLTPGTLTITIDRQSHVLYVHGMFVSDRDSFEVEISDMEARMLKAVRRMPRQEPNTSQNDRSL